MVTAPPATNCSETATGRKVVVELPSAPRSWLMATETLTVSPPMPAPSRRLALAEIVPAMPCGVISSSAAPSLSRSPTSSPVSGVPWSAPRKSPTLVAATFRLMTSSVVPRRLSTPAVVTFSKEKTPLSDCPATASTKGCAAVPS